MYILRITTSQESKFLSPHLQFSMIAKPLFTSYVVAVCTSPGGNFDEDVLEWVEESCRLKPLRKCEFFTGNWLIFM